MGFLEKELAEIEGLIEFGHLTNTKISNKSIAWHLDHSLKVIMITCTTIKKSDPQIYKYKFNKYKTLLSIINFIPRGKARAPKIVLPPENIETEDLYKQLEIVKKEVAELVNLDANSNFMHPYFKMLNLKETCWFLKLHTVHHLKICRELIK